MFADRKVRTFPVFVFLTFLYLINAPAAAQEVIVCKSQQDGYPRGASTEWKVDSFPANLTLFYNHGKTTIDDRAVVFVIEPESGLGIASSETSVVVSQGRNWVSATFSFERGGKYAISAYRSDRSILAATHIVMSGPEKQVRASAPVATTQTKDGAVATPVLNVSRDGERYEGPQQPPATKVAVAQPISAEEEKTFRFDDVNIAFGTGIHGRKLEGVADRFTDAQARKGIVVQLSNPVPFSGTAVSMDIWRKSSEQAPDFDEMVVSSVVAVSPKAHTVHAPMTLFKKGDYKVSFFSSDMVWIGSAYLTVQ